MTHFAGKAAKVLFLTGTMTLLLTAHTMAADIAIGAGCTTGSSLRMRAETSTSSEIITTLDKSVAVAILDDTTEGWYQVAYNGKTGYVSADYLLVDQDNVFETYGRVNGDGVNVRSGASAEAEVLASVNTGTIVTVNGLVDGWYDVTCQYGTKGYIRSDFLDLTKDATSSTASGSGIVDTAMKHLGTRYSYGGASPSGFDCSGFTMYVYEHFGYSLPHGATPQMNYGSAVSRDNLSVGDLIFFFDSDFADSGASHVGIYIGGGKLVHASSGPGYCVKVSSFKGDSSTGNYYSSVYLTARHIAD